jgi:predicted amidohydrolase YtcJ
MFFILFILPGLFASETADLAVVNARVYTADAARPVADAIAVRAGRIVAVGRDVSAYIGPGTRRIDARGATIIPGFIDSHGHMAGLGASMEVLDLRNVPSIEGVAGLVRQEAARRKAGEWILGRGWDQTLWGGGFPTEEPLSAAAPDHPVYLMRVDGHAAWVNRKALEIAGVTASTPEPPGGKILRGASGRPAGILIDRAEDLASRKIPTPPAEQLRQRLERAALACSRSGITTVHDAGVGAEEIAAYRILLQERKLPVRVYAMIGGTGPLWDEFQKRGPEVGERLTIRSIKLVADGALGSRGAALLAPYSNDAGNSGLLILSRAEIERVARQALAHGFQVNTHAIGDRANRTALEAYGAVLGKKNDRRFRIEHAQVVAPEDFELFARYSVIAAVQATHATSDMRWAETRLGPERVKGAYAWRRFLSLGVPVANGSDFPVEEPNPLRGFYAAITRQDESGNPSSGWFPEQRMSRQEALRSWTVGGAYAAFEEQTKGSLTPGKLADFVMLSDDIMIAAPREILKTRVLMTVVGGEVVYAP